MGDGILVGKEMTFLIILLVLFGYAIIGVALAGLCVRWGVINDDDSVSFAAMWPLSVTVVVVCATLMLIYHGISDKKR